LLKNSVMEFEHLQSLDISHVDLNGLQMVIEILPKLRELKTFELTYTDLNAKDIEKLAGALPIGLQELILRGNYFDSSGMRNLAMSHLAGIFPYLSELSGLDLSNNRFGDTAIKILAKVLPSMTKLKILKLDDNDIGNDGGIHLAQALAGLSRLSQLNLRRNHLGAKGKNALRDVSAALPRLKTNTDL